MTEGYEFYPHKINELTREMLSRDPQHLFGGGASGRLSVDVHSRAIAAEAASMAGSFAAAGQSSFYASHGQQQQRQRASVDWRGGGGGSGGGGGPSSVVGGAHDVFPVRNDEKLRKAPPPRARETNRRSSFDVRSLARTTSGGSPVHSTDHARISLHDTTTIQEDDRPLDASDNV